MGAPLQGAPDRGTPLELAPGCYGGGTRQEPRAYDEAVPFQRPTSVPVAQPAVEGGRQDEQKRRETPGDVEDQERDQGCREDQEHGRGGGPEDVAAEGAPREGV